MPVSSSNEQGAKSGALRRRSGRPEPCRGTAPAFCLMARHLPAPACMCNAGRRGGADLEGGGQAVEAVVPVFELLADPRAARPQAGAWHTPSRRLGTSPYFA